MPRPLAAQVSLQGRMRRLGVLVGYANDSVFKKRAAALVQGLDAHGWTEGGNLRIDWRAAGGDPVLFERHAAELVALGPDVLVCQSSPAVAELRRQTGTIPIVFVMVTDPVGQGLVASVARPGGNITGFTDYDPPMAGKWLEMLRQITPPVARVAVLFDPGTAPFAGQMMRTIEAAAASFAMSARAAPVRDDAEIEAVMTALTQEARAGLLVLPDVFTSVHRGAIIALASQHSVPAVYPFSAWVADGGLMSYGIDPIDPFRRSAAYVDRLLKGDKPADLPVQQPAKFELMINLKTARALGVTVAPVLIAGASEIVE